MFVAAEAAGRNMATSGASYERAYSAAEAALIAKYNANKKEYVEYTAAKLGVYGSMSDPETAKAIVEISDVIAKLAIEGNVSEEAGNFKGGSRGKIYKQRGGGFKTFFTGVLDKLTSTFPKITAQIKAGAGAFKGAGGAVAGAIDSYPITSLVVLIQIGAALGLPPPYNFIAKWALNTILAATPTTYGILSSIFSTSFSGEVWLMFGQLLSRLSAGAAAVFAGILFRDVMTGMSGPVYNATMTVLVSIFVGYQEAKKAGLKKFTEWIQNAANKLVARVGAAPPMIPPVIAAAARGEVPPAADLEAAADGAAVRAAAAAGIPLERYKVGAMLFSGPGAAALARQFGRLPPEANLSAYRVAGGGYRKHRKTKARKGRKHRKSRKAHRKSRRQH